MGTCQSLNGQLKDIFEPITIETPPQRMTERQIALIQAYFRGALIRKRLRSKIHKGENKSEHKQLATDDDQIPQTITERSTVTQQIDDPITETPSQKSKSLSYWQNATFTGLGKMETSDGCSLEGMWVNGLLNGEGVYINPNGSYYKGQWKNSQLNGQGLFYNSINNTTYEGAWLQNLQHGFGIEIYDDKSKYCGEFLNGIKNGQGQFEFADGSLYIGQFKSDKFHGKGKFVWDNKTKVYDGEWEFGKKNGLGVLECVGKYIYKGSYKQGKKNGNGTLIYHDGRQYNGEWLDGQQHGYGTFQQSNGSIYNGIWKFGLFQAP